MYLDDAIVKHSANPVTVVVSISIIHVISTECDPYPAVLPA